MSDCWSMNIKKITGRKGTGPYYSAGRRRKVVKETKKWGSSGETTKKM